MSSAENATTTKVATTRKVYTSPQLVRLGSVRDLTFGASGGFGDSLGLAKKSEK